MPHLHPVRWFTLSICLLLPLLIRAEERYVRYKLLEPAVSTVATLSVQTHAATEDLGLTSFPAPLPGVITYHKLYVPAGQWSEWRKLPNPPFWGTVYLHVKGVDPLPQVKTQLQVATAPAEKWVVRTFSANSETGGSVGFIIPRSLLDTPEQIESLEETFLRRRKVAESVAVPPAKRPKLLRFGGFGVNGDVTVKGSQRYEEATTHLLGFNMGMPGQQYPYLMEASATGTVDWVQKLQFSEEEIKKLSCLMIFDEPAWYSGFMELWQATGDARFRTYLKEQGVTPDLFGKQSLDQVSWIHRDHGVPADAPIEQRRLWFWSCRYLFDAQADYFAEITRHWRERYPHIPTTVNQGDHPVLLEYGSGIAWWCPDLFAWGRRNAVGMQWSEDWLFGGLRAWGNGMYQRAGYMAELLRGAQRYQPTRALGFHVVGNDYAPAATGIDRSFSVRVNLLLGSGVKTFSFYSYGPTHTGTTDFWADAATNVRGVADAIQLCGGDAIEPYLNDGYPVPAQTCLIYSTTASYWQEVNKDIPRTNVEKLHLYAMLTQEQIPVEIIDNWDLSQFIDQYKVAYLVDRNMTTASAQALVEWVKAGGMLVLWPDAASRDEFNSPLQVLPAAAGRTSLGAGVIIRFPDSPGALWWENTVKMNTDAGYGWPALFDDEQRRRVCQPALERIKRPIIANAPGILTPMLVSERGVAIPLVNIQGTFPEGGTRYLNAKITLADGKGISKAYSSRLGPLQLRREGEAVSVVMPLESTDILVFAR